MSNLMIFQVTDQAYVKQVVNLRKAWSHLISLPLTYYRTTYLTLLNCNLQYKYNLELLDLIVYEVDAFYMEISGMTYP